LIVEGVWFGFDSLVESVVVVVDVVIHLAVEVGAGLGRIQVEVVLFDGSLESFNPRIVRGSAFTGHRDFNILLLKK
jgi:hypothetical protein